MSFHKSNFYKHLAQTSESPLAIEIVDASGVYLEDIDGKKYMDLIAGIGVSILGHKNPVVVEAVKNQAERYMHTMVYGEFVLAPQVQLATELSEVLPSPLDSAYLVNSGAEAIEGAMKLAKRYTGRKKIIAANKSYHGSTQGAMSLISEIWFAGPFYPLLPGIEFVDFNDLNQLEIIDETVAAVLFETVKGEEGVIVPSMDYLKKVKERCEEVGALLILDEIQAGYGRTGKMFAFEHFGVIPDILCLAKGFGGGMPIGAFVSSNEIMRVLTFDPVLGHITTYGGHPVSAAAALATIQTLKNSDYIDQVPSKNLLIQSILDKYELEYRNIGLWFAIQLNNFDEVLNVVKKGLERGVFVDWFLFNDSSIRLAPPLVITHEELSKGVEIVAALIHEELNK